MLSVLRVRSLTMPDTCQRIERCDSSRLWCFLGLFLRAHQEFQDFVGPILHALRVRVLEINRQVDR